MSIEFRKFLFRHLTSHNHSASLVQSRVLGPSKFALAASGARRLLCDVSDGEPAADYQLRATMVKLNHKWLAHLFIVLGTTLRILLWWANPPRNSFDDHFEPIRRYDAASS